MKGVSAMKMLVTLRDRAIRRAAAAHRQPNGSAARACVSLFDANTFVDEFVYSGGAGRRRPAPQRRRIQVNPSRGSVPMMKRQGMSILMMLVATTSSPLAA